jgi:predicted ATPase/class 3 adenylate cyclase
MPELPTGTVTFLFTDIEGSTRLWEEHSEAMRHALARHDEILRDAVTSNGGHVVKTTGDGIYAVFGTAHDALAATVDGQRAITAESWPLHEPLHVRMGLHTGPADERDGDYFGPTLNRTARLMAAGHGGQILVSNASEELVRDVLPEGVELLDLGSHRLRDLARPDRVFQVCAPDLETRFPDLRTLDSFPGNLPVQLTSFIGRDDEIKTLRDALSASRLVTLTGVGGVGKTRLAIQLSADVVPEFPDGAWLCELAGADDSDAMIQLVAATLGVQPRPGTTLEGAIVEFLRAKELLLVLDNCEHVLDTAGRIAERVLGACPNVRVVATSREGLAVAGEQVWPLRSLSLPETVDVAEVGASDAVRLFEERALAVRPGFVIDASDATAVAEICRRLDGIPLAIELAAARVASMSPRDIATRLDERFRLLTGGRRTAVERHQTLRATVDWSYSMLEDHDRTVFDRLGVFTGGFDVASAEAVVSGDGVEAWDVVDGLSDLVAKSMISTEVGPAGATRYQMLETMRHYAREQLDAHDDADRWRRRHAERFAEFADDAGPAIRGPDELVWRHRLAAELDNLRSAVTWSLESADDADHELGLRIIAALAMQESFDPSLGIGAWAERAIDAAEASQPGRRHAVLAAAGYHRATAGRYDDAVAVARSALRDGVPADSPWPGLATNVLSFVDLQRGNIGSGVERLEAFLASPDASLLDLQEQVTFHAMTGGILAGTGEIESGRDHTELALDIARRSGSPSALCSALFSDAVTHRFADPDRCIAELEQCIELTRAGATPVVFGYASASLAMMLGERGDRDGSLRALREALTFTTAIGDHPQLLNVCASAVQALSPLGIYEPIPTFAGSIMAVVADHPSDAGSVVEAFLGACASAREALGADVFDAELSRGMAMSYDELVEYARHTLDDLLADESA